MTSSTAVPTKRETLNIRIRPEERGLIDRAAHSQGKNRTDFILEAARAAAEEALLSRTVLMADEGAYADFLARLNRQPDANPHLRQTMRHRAPWDA